MGIAPLPLVFGFPGTTFWGSRHEDTGLYRGGLADRHSALAQDTTTKIKEERILGSNTTVETKKTEPSTATSTELTTTGAVGCTTETKQKTDAFGDTATTKKTEC